MYYKYGGSHIGTMVETNRYASMYRSDKLEFVVNQSIWFEGEAKFADVILPACTNFERWDISEFANCGGYIQHASPSATTASSSCSTSASSRWANRNRTSRYSSTWPSGWASAMFSEGVTEFDWCRRLFDATDLPQPSLGRNS